MTVTRTKRKPDHVGGWSQQVTVDGDQLWIVVQRLNGVIDVVLTTNGKCATRAA